MKIWKLKALLSADSTGNDSPSLNKNHWKLSVCTKPLNSPRPDGVITPKFQITKLKPKLLS